MMYEYKLGVIAEQIASLREGLHRSDIKELERDIESTQNEIDDLEYDLRQMLSDRDDLHQIVELQSEANQLWIFEELAAESPDLDRVIALMAAPQTIEQDAV
jgi:hypothetical protein